MRRRIDHLEVAVRMAVCGERTLSVEEGAWACRRIRALEAALEAARRDHDFMYDGETGGDDPCGADKHNAAIDAALVEEP